MVICHMYIELLYVFYPFILNPIIPNNFPLKIICLIVAPLIIPFTFGDEPANPGDSNAVNCMVTKGDLPLTITWSMNGRILNDDLDGVSIVRMSARLSSLNIDSISPRHRGIFQCIAINEAGMANHSTELLINGDLIVLD